MSRFLDLIDDDRPHLWDGGMGTELYARGVFINQCYDELNLTRPELVAEIHRAYALAGAQILETNTFGANRLKLEPFGLAEQVADINRAAVQIARRAGGADVLVAGAIGPLGVRIEPFGPTALEEARAFFREQAEALAEAGSDVILLETFSSDDEMVQAILGVKEACDLPVVAQMTIGEDLHTAYGTSPEHFLPRLEEAGADVLGFNCSVGPHAMLAAVERVLPLTALRLSIQPNAGQPRAYGGRTMYMASPEYMATYAQRLSLKGVKFLGGCCGTTPDHIARIADAVRSVSPGTARIKVRAPAEKERQVDIVPLALRSDFGRKIAAGEIVTSVEIVPPRGVDPEKMLRGVRLLKAAGVDAVNVPDGPRAQMRMGVMATSVLIEQRVGIEAVVHYACRDRNLLGMLSDLLGAQAIGLRNLLLITGDPPKMGPYPEATAVFDIDSIGLTNLVSALNRGVDPGGNAIGAPTSFVIGVGVNPGAIDLEVELQRFYWKVEAGAEFAITQPVFDVDQLARFLRELDQRGLRIPIVAGIWPLVSLRNAEFLANEVPGIDVPPRIIERMRKAQEVSKEHAVQEGISVAREVWAEIGSELQGIQVSAPFGRVPLALEVFADVPTIRPAPGLEDDAPLSGFRPPSEA